MIDLPSPFPILFADATCKTLLGSAPMRVFPHGSAEQGTAYPYVTYSSPSMFPINSLDSEPARADSTLVQVSIWSQNGGTGPTSARDVYRAVRSALEQGHDIEAVRDMGKDPDTGSYRIDLDVRMFVHRESSSSS